MDNTERKKKKTIFKQLIIHIDYLKVLIIWRVKKYIDRNKTKVYTIMSHIWEIKDKWE